MKLPKLNPPTVFIDASFVRALTDPTSAHHVAATTIYRSLVEQFRDERVLLVAAEATLSAVPRPIRATLLAPIAKAHVAGRFRSAAVRMLDTAGGSIERGLAVDLDFATQLVLLQRERIERVATFDTRFEQYEVTIEQLPDVLPEPSTGPTVHSNAE